MWDSNLDACGYVGRGLGWYCCHLGGLRDAEDPGAGAQTLSTRLEGLEAPSRQTQQECRVCQGLKGSFEH